VGRSPAVQAISTREHLQRRVCLAAPEKLLAVLI
jgi:hypothetical protein